MDARMNDDMPSASVILASARDWNKARTTVESVVASAAAYPGSCRLILVRDVAKTADNGIYHDAASFGEPAVTVLHTGGGCGSALTRYRGIRHADTEILLFTDDDTLVPRHWVTHMVQAASRHGTCTGNLKSRSSGFWELCDEKIDDYRIHARDRYGATKFASFPNFAIQRCLLPSPPYELSTNNLADDVDLACTLRLHGVAVHLDPSIVVSVDYPTSFRRFLLRKIRHGRGMGRLRIRLGRQTWMTLDLGRLRAMIPRWLVMSRQLCPHARPAQRVLLTVANVAYCVALLVTASASALPRRRPPRLTPNGQR
jgi:hypothetical protein